MLQGMEDRDERTIVWARVVCYGACEHVFYGAGRACPIVTFLTCWLLSIEKDKYD